MHCSTNDSPTIFVIYHKSAEVYNLPSNYKTIFVGKSCNFERNDMYKISHKMINFDNKFFEKIDYYDNIGDNISEYNHIFSEITGMYWVWKNLSFKDDDYVGFCAYRRICLYPPDYKRYDININSYFNKNDTKFDNKTIYLKYYLTNDRDNIYKYFNDSDLKLFENEDFKHNVSREIFVLKWKCFNELMENMVVFIESMKTNFERFVSPAHVMEYILCFCIWKLSKKYYINQNIDYILPETDYVTYRNNE